MYTLSLLSAYYPKFPVTASVIHVHIHFSYPLFKVIYALNTKNDEHEFILQNLREQHEEEIQQLLAETKAKVIRSFMNELYERTSLGVGVKLQYDLK